MSKMLKMNSLFGQRPLLAISLAASVMAFGCTTDRTLGNGDLGGRSGVPAAPTSGVTSGSETEPTPTLPPPMTSSYLRPEALPKVARSVRRLTADEAAMLMAEHKPKYRVLGTVDPALSGNVYHSANLITGQNPAITTYNSSITSGATGAIGAIVNNVGSAATNTSPITPVSLTAGTIAPATATAPLRVVSSPQRVTITNQQ